MFMMSHRCRRRTVEWKNFEGWKMLSYLDSIKRKIEKISRDFHETRRGVDLTSEKGKNLRVFLG